MCSRIIQNHGRGKYRSVFYTPHLVHLLLPKREAQVKKIWKNFFDGYVAVLSVFTILNTRYCAEYSAILLFPPPPKCCVDVCSMFRFVILIMCTIYYNVNTFLSGHWTVVWRFLKMSHQMFSILITILYMVILKLRENLNFF